MKVYKKEFMKKYLTDDHGFDDNENMCKYTALDLITENCNSSDRKIFLAYWESPKGSFQWDFSKAGEIGYIIEGEMTLTNNVENFDLSEGDCYYFETGEVARFIIKKFVKLFIVSFPIEKDLQASLQIAINFNKNNNPA